MIKTIKKKMNRSTLLFVIEIIFVVLICLLHALEAGHYVNFSPINGTFQNYNPVRRLLSGQIPYRDFQDYLGLGHLYSGAVFTLLGGGKFKASIIAFRFLSMLSIGLCSFLVSYVIFQRKEVAGACTNIFLILLITGPFFLNNGLAAFQEVVAALQGALDSGNSARFIRGAILPIECMIVLVALQFYSTHLFKKINNQKYRNHLACIVIGVIAGFAFAWSTDYGISCWLCTGIIFFIITVTRTKKIGKSLIYFIEEMLASVIGTVLIVEIFTLGHLNCWTKSIFGTGGYQSWYYNGPKSYYIFDIDLSFFMVLQAVICIVYIVKLIKAGATIEAIKRYGILGFVNMTCFCAVNEYKLLSGGDSKEVALSVLFLTIFYETVNAFVMNKRVVALVSIVISASWLVFSAKSEYVFNHFTQKEGEYIESLGGNMTVLGTDLKKTHEFLHGEPIWATYASGQDVVEGKYQPSGTDYIIHVSGDDARREYLQKYETNNWTYTSTIKESYSEWEYWAQRANWFFYRQIYKNCHPVYSNYYALYWERNDDENQNFQTSGYQISLADENENTKKIIVKCDREINGFADVYIDYTVKKVKKNSSLFVWNTHLKLENTGIAYSQLGREYNYLRSKSKEYIPVRIVNGYGEVTLSSEPQQNTILELNDYKCDGIYTVVGNYVEIKDLSVVDGKTEIMLQYTQENLDKTHDISNVEIQNQQGKVINMEVDEQAQCIKLTVDSVITYDENVGNQLHIIRQ